MKARFYCEGEIYMEHWSKIIEQNKAMIQESIIIFQEQMKPVIEGLAIFQQSMKEVIEGIDLSAILEAFQKFIEDIESYGDSSERFKTYIVEMGYPPHYELLPAEVIDIVRLYETDKEKATSVINLFMLEKFNPDAIEQMFEKWIKTKWTENRTNVFRDIINAHKYGFYSVSIPATLAQIEGLIAQGFGHVGKMNGFHMEEYLKRLLSEEGQLSFDEAIKVFYLRNVLGFFEHGKPINSFLSRNAILHGADVKYGTPENSLKSILLLDYIHDKITEFQEKVL